MTWTCPNCDRDYPDSALGVPRGESAADKEACEWCYVSPAGTVGFVSPASLNDR